EETDDSLIARARLEAAVEVQHRRYDAGSAIGRSCDHAAARGVLLVDGQGECVHPVHRIEWLGRAALGQDAEQLRRPAAHLERSRQHAGLMEAALDAALHYLPKMQHARADLSFARPRALVRHY